ncbi:MULTISPECIES: helix-turn-helix domain-containing protein [unclassified Faecalibacterium]|uniref:TetR/AcrR family transcriptional regulator n=1 Tax=unclassified Faecalibacterium TaxID=2646395 RepID=UPI0026D430AD
MARKNTYNTKGKIIEAAWDLFYRQGYDDTTVEEIIAASGTSRGSFYHYFEGKDALLSSLSYLFDHKYEELSSTLNPEMNRFDQLMYLNRELFAMVENSISLDLLARLYSSQLVTRGGQASSGSQPHLLQTAPEDRDGGPAAGRIAGGCDGQRDGAGLRAVRAGADL